MDTLAKLKIMTSFPNLASTKFEKTSDPTGNYNCIAWAAGENHRWWWPDGMGIHHWPSVPREISLPAFIQVFSDMGFACCTNDDLLESEIIRVAIFADPTGRPTHASRQRIDGLWTSKLGPQLDMKHVFRGVEGNKYGTIQQVMKASLSSLALPGSVKHSILTACD